MWWIELALVAIGAVGTVATAVVDHTERRANRVLWKVLAVGMTLMASWRLFFSDNSLLFRVRPTTVELPAALPMPAPAPAAVAPPVSKPVPASTLAPKSSPVAEVAPARASAPTMPHRLGASEKLWRPQEPSAVRWFLKYTLWLWVFGFVLVLPESIREVRRGRATSEDVRWVIAGMVAFGAGAWWV